MDIKAYAYTNGSDRITVVYGMQSGKPDIYFVKVSDDTQVSGWKFIQQVANYRDCFETLATARGLITSMGYTEIV